MRLLPVLGRSVLALAVLATTGAVVVAGVRIPAPDVGPVAPIAVDVPAAATVLVCPGPLRLPTELEPGDDAAYDPRFDTSPAEPVTQLAVISARPGDAGAAEGAVRALGGASDVARLTGAGGAFVLRLPGPDGARVLRADDVDGAPAWLAGTLHVRTDAGDLRGLATAPCEYPSAQTWLVGGGTELGSSARLVLANPGATPASVTVSMWGSSGPVEPATTPEYLVPPGDERVVLLEGVAAEQSRVVVRVVAEGGLVTAYLQDSRMRGLVPAGVDLVVGGQAPARQQVVPGLSITGGEADDGETALLRVLAPGEQGGTVDVTLLGPDGPVVLPGANAPLEPGAVLDIPLSGVAAGDYTAVVTADVPVVAGALLSRVASSSRPGEDAPSERAWAPSAAVGRPGPLALPGGATGDLLLAVVPQAESRGRAQVAIDVYGADGSVTVLERRVAEGATVSVPLEDLAGGDAGGVVLRSEDPRVAWVVVLASGDMVSVLAPVAPRAPQPQVGVRLR